MFSPSGHFPGEVRFKCKSNNCSTYKMIALKIKFSSSKNDVNNGNCAGLSWGILVKVTLNCVVLINKLSLKKKFLKEA